MDNIEGFREEIKKSLNINKRYDNTHLIERDYYNLAGYYSINGELEKALNYLKKLHINKNLYINLIPKDPDFVNLRDDEEYIKILENLED
ncbi:MAG: hypothetical protein GF311_02690 [Candidatus Lokiarchaeota archaeon]|nr:hypothetical protein [Candidatus Lokiarchaeota archaeon]